MGRKQTFPKRRERGPGHADTDLGPSAGLVHAGTQPKAFDRVQRTTLTRFRVAGPVRVSQSRRLVPISPSAASRRLFRAFSESHTYTHMGDDISEFPMWRPCKDSIVLGAAVHHLNPVTSIPPPILPQICSRPPTTMQRRGIFMRLALAALVALASVAAAQVSAACTTEGDDPTASPARERSLPPAPSPIDPAQG